MESDMDFHAQLRKALGLADSADEAAIVSAASARQTALTLHSTQLGEIAALAGVPGKGVTEVITALTARGTSETDLAGKVLALQTQLDTLTTTTAKEKAVTAVDAAIAAGKPVKALREHYISRHTQDPTGVERELAAMLSLNAGGLGNRPDPTPGADGLTAEDRQVIALMGSDPEAFKKAKAAAGQEVI